MQKSDADKQIQIMINFILQEAKEREKSIGEEADRLAASEKGQKVQQGRVALQEEFTRKKKERLVSRRIDKSRRAADARVQKMRERDNVMKLLKEEVTEKLADIASNKLYPDLIKYLIAQGLMIITENKVTIQCRKEDLAVVKAQLPAAIKLYQEFIKASTGITPISDVQISNDHLPSGPQKGKKSVSCCGGIVLNARNGAIVCKNTLDSRLDLCFQNLIPQIRGVLFGVRGKPVQKEEVEEKHH
jgi:V-type H+-transporting ATPase subunit E